MAVTGIGTVEDPFLVGSYTEIKTVCSSSENSGKYVKLSQDIDCNSYGDSWEWLGFEVCTNIDFNGHYIKNGVIAPDSNFFTIRPFNNENITIENGGILNIFGNQAIGFIESYSNDVKALFKNMQFSTNINTILSHAFKYFACLNCSFYICTAVLLNPIFYTSPYGSTSEIGACYKNCDFWFDIGNINQKHISEHYPVIGSRIFDSCRFRGIIRSGIRPSNMLTQYGYMNSCVWEVDTCGTSQGDYDDSSDKLTSETSNGIRNSILCPLRSTSGEQELTTIQMRNSEYLNSIGFTVIELENNLSNEDGGTNG